MSNYSLEHLYNIGTGITTNNKTVSSNNNYGYDGYSDGLLLDVELSSEMLNFYDTFEKINNQYIDQKIRMMNKLKIHYGRCHESIESYCNSYIRSLEEAEPSKETPKDTQTTDKNKDNKEEKNGNFIVRLARNILGIIRKIGSFIMSKIRAFKSWIASKFGGKKKPDGEQPTNEQPSSGKMKIKNITKDEKAMGLFEKAITQQLKVSGTLSIHPREFVNKRFDIDRLSMVFERFDKAMVKMKETIASAETSAKVSSDNNYVFADKLLANIFEAIQLMCPKLNYQYGKRQGINFLGLNKNKPRNIDVKALENIKTALDKTVYFFIDDGNLFSYIGNKISNSGPPVKNIGEAQDMLNKLKVISDKINKIDLKNFDKFLSTVAEVEKQFNSKMNEIRSFISHDYVRNTITSVLKLLPTALKRAQSDCIFLFDKVNACVNFYTYVVENYED